MRIAILNSFYHPDEPGGAEHFTRVLVGGLVRQGHDVTVICLGRQRQSTVHAGVRIERLPIRNAYLPIDVQGKAGALARLGWHVRDTYNSAAAQDVAGVLRECRPEILHTNTLTGFSAAIWRVACELKTGVVHTLHDYYLLCPRTTMMKQDNCSARACATCRFFGLPRKLASQDVSHVVGVSRFILDRHLRCGYFHGLSSTVIHNPFEMPEVPRSASASTIRLGFIGRLVPTKGLESLLDAFEAVHRLDPDVDLTIAGNGAPDYVDRLRKRCVGLPVRFAGHVRPEAFYPRVDFIVVPSSWNDPCPRVVIESMTFGKPVVATPVGGIPELIGSNQGIIAADTSCGAVAKAMKAMVDALRIDNESVSRECRAWSQAFRVERIVEQYVGVYSQVLERGRSCSL